MQKEPLTKLLDDLEQEMLRLGYTEGTMEFYYRRLQMLLQFAKERGETHYSEQLGIGPCGLIPEWDLPIPMPGSNIFR